MRHPILLRTLAAVVLLLIVACGDKHEPVKPTVDVPAALSVQVFDITLAR